MKADPLSSDASLVFLTNRVGRLLVNHIRKQAHTLFENGLQPQHMGILVDLWIKDGVNQRDLAVSNIKNKGTITRTITHLEELNILVRVPDPQDKRNKRIYLTHKGRALKSSLVPHAEQVVSNAIQDIPEEKVAVCKEVLLEIYKQLMPD